MHLCYEASLLLGANNLSAETQNGSFEMELGNSSELQGAGEGSGIYIQSVFKEKKSQDGETTARFRMWFSNVAWIEWRLFCRDCTIRVKTCGSILLLLCSRSFVFISRIHIPLF